MYYKYMNTLQEILLCVTLELFSALCFIVQVPCEPCEGGPVTLAPQRTTISCCTVQ